MRGGKWSGARERWTAFWNGNPLGRSCLTVTAPSGRKVEIPTPVSGEEKWLDPDFVVRRMLAEYEATWYGGEAMPSSLLMAGWAVNAYGSTPHFPMDTIWFDPMKVDWSDPPTFVPDFQSECFRKVLALHQAALAAAGRDNFMVGHGCFLPGNDMLPLLIGSQEFLFALSDRPDWTRLAIMKLAQNRVEFLHYFHDLARKTHDFWYGNAGWMPFWAPEMFMPFQSDISCMLSCDMFGEFIIPELDLNAREFKNLWYHLDGQSAFHHLPALLSLPYMKVIQFTPEAGTPPNGPAHLDLYRRIQAAGRIVHIQVPQENVRALAKALDPTLLCMDTWCSSVRDAEGLLSSLEGRP